MEMVYNLRPFGQEKRRTGGRRLGLIVALAVGLPLAGAVGYAVDQVRGYAVQAKLSQAVDSAALAGGRVMFDDQRDGHIKTFFEAAFPKGFLGCDRAALSIAEDPGTGTLTVSGKARVEAMFLGLFGFDDLIVEARSIIRRNGKALRATL
ncbi:pilus assembly protein TadG-related protein [Azospirillum sp. SYSU D00513]|uniref:pilus assembly protein TadG-related protein n=1 Tax=Azospirillum sp. SYSU D00513 TaxID=2812561 RepID=UPI001A97970C|nr:pilus assembly protein TadG-related protein [Azospirillum sp. SYSU D00513]